jgi:hypothetical protein
VMTFSTDLIRASYNVKMFLICEFI